MANEITINQIVTAKDLANIFGYKLRTAERRLKNVRVILSKAKGGDVTLYEFCMTLNINYPPKTTITATNRH